MFRVALHWQILLAMIVGAGAGSLINVTIAKRGTQDAPEHITLDAYELSIFDSPGRIEFTIVSTADQKRRRFVVDGSLSAERARELRETGNVVVPTIDELANIDKQAHDLFTNHGRSKGRRVADACRSLGNLFLRMLKMVSIPLIVTSLITGVTGLGGTKQLGKMFGRTILYYLSTSMLAIVTGLLMVNAIRPGLRGNEAPAAHAPDHAAPAEAKSLGTVMFEQVENLIPANPAAAVANGDFLSVIAFSIAFGIFTILVGGETGEFLAKFFRSAFEVMMAMTMAIIHLAPLGVLFLMLNATASQGVDVFRSLGWYMITVLCALAIHAFIVLPLIIRFVAGRSPYQFAQAMSPALVTAFSSASSNATLPLTMASVEERAGVSNKVSSFVLPLGATINMDGTALYEAVAVLFIAQMTGHDLSLMQQLIVALTALLASIGAAGIPHAGLVMMMIILQAVGLPTESQGLIIAVDRVLDMCRTSVNVWSDSCGCAVIDRIESRGTGAPG